MDNEFEEMMRAGYEGMLDAELRTCAIAEGARVPDWYPTDDIIDVLVGRRDPEPDTFAEHRARFKAWLRENWSFTKEALDCDGNCDNHPTELFILCLVRSGQADEYFEGLQDGTTRRR